MGTSSRGPRYESALCTLEDEGESLLTKKLRIGVSSCILGNRVRFDSGHKRSRFVTKDLGDYAEFVSVCPEVEIGLGTPRESIRLVRQGGEIRLVAPKSGQDLTEQMQSHSERRVAQIAEMGLSGFVLKAGSPSCGMERVRVYDEKGCPRKDGTGMFAEVLKARLPLLPIEEDGRLNDARLRENFVERVFGFSRVTQLFEPGWSVSDLVAFHASEKLLLQAHDPSRARSLGRLVARAKTADRDEVQTAYREGFVRALERLPSPRAHANVLQYILGFFRRHLVGDDRREILQLIEEFRKGLVPIVVPLALVRHHIRRLGIDYLATQSYLEPHPRPLALRSYV